MTYFITTTDCWALKTLDLIAIINSKGFGQHTLSCMQLLYRKWGGAVSWLYGEKSANIDDVQSTMFSRLEWQQFLDLIF